MADNTGYTNPFGSEADLRNQTSGVITNIQNEDTLRKQNMGADEEHRYWLETIAEEYRRGLINDESITEACQNQNPPLDPTQIIAFCNMTNLEREQSPYFKTDLRDVETKGYEYNGTLQDGDTITVAGCTITATEYNGVDEVADTDDVFGLEMYEKDAKYDALMDRSDWDIAWELAPWDTAEEDKVDEDDWMPDHRTLYHCHSDYLGDFDYDPTMYRIGYKEIREENGSVSQLPVLEYIGPAQISNTWVCMSNANDWTEAIASTKHENVIDDCEDVVNNMIPEGVKVLDYTFCTPYGRFIEFLPFMPEGVTSANYTFAGCEGTVFPDMDEMDKNNCNDMSAKIYMLPSTLECGQGTFMDCHNLQGNFYMRNPEFVAEQEERGNYWHWTNLSVQDGYQTKISANPDSYYDQLPSSVVNIVNMYSGCDALDEEYCEGWNDTSVFGFNFFGALDHRTYGTFQKANFGGELTPYLSPELMRGVYDDIQDSTAKMRGVEGGPENFAGYFKDDSRESIIDEYGGINEGYDVSGLDAAKLAAARSAQMILFEGKIDSGWIDTSVEVASDGQRTNNKCKDEDGSTYYDSTGRKISYQDKMHDTSAWWEKWAQVGAIGLVAGLGGGVITKNKWWGLAAGVAGGFVASKFVPSSLYPIVHATAEFFHSEKLEELANKLPGAESYKRNKEIEEFNKDLAAYNAQWDNNYNLGKANYDPRISDVFGNVTTEGRISMLVDKNCITSMTNNGFACAKELNFAGVASLGEDNAACVTDTMTEAIDVANNQFTERFGDGSKLTEADKAEMRNYYTFLMESIEAYSNGAREGIANFDTGVPAKVALQTDGLGMIDRAYVETAMNKLTELNAKYDFMDDATWNKFAEYEVEGVDMEHLRDYNGASYFAEEREYIAGKTVQDIRDLAVVDADFKAAMGNEMDNLDARVPEGWVSRETNEVNPEATQADDKDAGAASTLEGMSVTDEMQALMNSALPVQNGELEIESNKDRAAMAETTLGVSDSDTDTSEYVDSMN